MTLLMGENEAENRMRRETMNPNGKVALDHNYYSEDPERHSRKGKHSYKMKDHDDDREHYAIGGAAKVRHKFPFTRGRK